MLNKLNVIILFYLLAINPCFSQKKQTDFTDSVLSQYNSYLSSVHLKQLIKATGFSYQKEIDHDGAAGKLKLTGVYVLTVEPDSAFSDPLKFENTWNSTLSTLKGENSAYWQLFSKLADCAQLPADSLVLFIKTSDPDAVSYIVYFDKGIKADEPTIGARTNAATPGDITPESLNNILYGCVFKNVKYNAGVKKALVTKLVDFLTSDNQGNINSAIKVKQVYRADNFIFFEARNLKGRVTKRFFEDITVNLIIMPATDEKKGQVASVGYSLNVQFSNRKFTGPANIENSENAILHHREEVQEYGAKLFQLFTNIVYANN